MNAPLFRVYLRIFFTSQANMNFQKQAMRSGKCYKCGDTDAAGYGYNESAKALHCQKCAMADILGGSNLDTPISSLKPEHRTARLIMIDRMCAVSKMDRETVAAIDSVIWLDATSLEEYQNTDKYVQQFKNFLIQASQS